MDWNARGHREGGRGDGVVSPNHDRIIEFDEPHQSGGNCRVTLTEDQAVEWWRKAHPGKFATREDAIDDFLVIHGAWYREDRNQ